jgi:hypothetical protein
MGVGFCQINGQMLKGRRWFKVFILRIVARHDAICGLVYVSNVADSENSTMDFHGKKRTFFISEN